MTAPDGRDRVPAPAAPPPPVASGGQIVAATSAGGSIYDLGYRGYEGPRLGRRHAVRSLVRQSFRQCWGMGRPGRAKVVPFGLAALATIPAVVALGVSALAKQLGAGEAIENASPIRYDTYYGLIANVVFLFTAAQAPELLARDMRHRVLALYFSRTIRREDYALGKLAAIVLAMLALILFPQGLIFVGRLLLASDIVAGFRQDAPLIVPVIAQALLTAALLGSLGLAIASFTPRRAYATASIFAAVLIPLVAVAAIDGLSGPDLAGPASLFSPADVLTGANDFFYGTTGGGPTDADVAPLVYALAGVVWTIVLSGILVARYRRVEP
jgi:ABC-2 type transport system permease protein